MAIDVPPKRQRTLKQFGVSPPISIAGPDATDLRLSSALEAELKLHGFTDDNSDATMKRVVQDLEALVVTFVHSVAIEVGLSDEQAASAGGKVLTLGSQALGVATPGADIDLLAVVPYFVERAHFFADGGLGGLLPFCNGLTGL